MDWILNLIADVVLFLRNWVAYLYEEVVGLFTALVEWTEWFLQSIATYVKALFDATLKSVKDYTTALLAQMKTQLDTITTMVSNLLTKLVGFVDTAMKSAQDTITRLYNAVIAQIDFMLSAVGNMIANVASQLRSLLSALISEVTEWLSATVESIQRLVTSAVSAVADSATSITATAKRGVEAMLIDTERTTADAYSRIESGWQALVAGARSYAAQLEGVAGDVGAAFSSAAKDIAEKIGTLGESGRDALESAFKLLHQKMVETLGEAPTLAQWDNVNKLVAGLPPGEVSREQIGALMRQIVPTSLVGGVLFHTLFSLGWVVQSYMGIGREISELFRQEWCAQYLPAILSEPDTIAAWRRGALTTDDAVERLKRYGYPAATGQTVLHNALGAPTPLDLTSQWRRGLIDEDTLRRGLKASGLADEWHVPTIEASMYLPPIPDLVHMAVREAFSPDVAAAFGQYEDYPAELTQYAEAQGLSEEWARRYWAAHWGLPSPMQGYEMLHRGLIDTSQLDMLLRALDVMPYWRDKLRAIAYNPYTRVDIRRMHKVGVLDEAGVERAHRDLGYDEEHARKLTEFVMRLNKPTSAESAAELGTLTRASILGFLRDGLLEESRAIEMLVDAGLTAQAAQLFVADVRGDQARQERKDEASLAVEMALAGMLSDTQLSSRLRALGLSQVEIDRAMTELYRSRVRRVKLPARSEAEAFYRDGLITQASYAGLLSELGYPAQWVEVYVAAADRKREAAAKRAGASE